MAWWLPVEFRIYYLVKETLLRPNWPLTVRWMQIDFRSSSPWYRRKQTRVINMKPTAQQQNCSHKYDLKKRKKKKETDRKVINSSQKRSFCLRFPLSRTCCPWAHCVPFHSLSSLLLLFFLSVFFFFSACRHPIWGGLCVSWQDAAANSGIVVVHYQCWAALSGCKGLSRSWYWGLCSHELWLLHRLLVCGWIPWGVAGNVRSGCAHWSLHGGRWAPDRCHRRRAARKSTASG